MYCFPRAERDPKYVWSILALDTFRLVFVPEVSDGFAIAGRRNSLAVRAMTESPSRAALVSMFASTLLSLLFLVDIGVVTPRADVRPFPQ
jgi:hypothetical protein